MKRPIIAATIAWAGALLLGAATLDAQSSPAVRFVDVGSEQERVLRVLQITGDVPLYPWSVRQFSPRELDRLRSTTKQQSGLLPAESRPYALSVLHVALLPVESRVIYNSAFPYGYNDGPLWAGRGLTGAISAGVAGRVGPLSFQLEPTVFDAQNTAFPLKPNGVASLPYADGFFPFQIDQPQRFGDAAYHRFDLGQSSVRLDVSFVEAELSTADQWWGPALVHPLILGNNAPGFPHVSLGSAHPINVLIGQIHGRLVAGELHQSEYSTERSADSLRFMSGIVGVFIPRGVPGLEIGVSRFFHSTMPPGGLRDAPYLRSLQGILKARLATATNPGGNNADNQLASAFFRWAVPASGFEFFGEYGREDHNVDLRDVEQEPDHDAGYTLGLQKAWKRGIDNTVAFRAEMLNTRLTQLNQGRPQAPWYIHTASVTQGHTVLGQVLGAPGGYGGGGSTVGVDVFSRSGRWTVEWDRQMRAEAGAETGYPNPTRADVMHAVGIERVRNIGTTAVTGAVRGVWDLNRDFSADRFNLNATFGLRMVW